LPDCEPMTQSSEATFKLISNSEDETRQIGNDIAVILQVGDLLALSGDLGAGKTALARAIIQHIASDETLEVASPSYTLCNSYELAVNVSHYDLYRLGDLEEVQELGLGDALDSGCAIIEWPEHGFDALPTGSVHLKIEILENEKREFLFSGDEKFLKRLQRSMQIRSFLTANSFEEARRETLSADASARRYEMIWPSGKENERWFLMDSPQMPDGPPVRGGKPYSQIAHLAENISAFVAIGNLLNTKGFAAPNIPACDLKQGFAVIEHLGENLIVDKQRAPIRERYMASMAFLTELHAQPFAKTFPLPDGTSFSIPSYDRDALMIEAELLLDWYAPHQAGAPFSSEQRQAFQTIWHHLFDLLDNQQQTLVLRDFHSPNIIWRGEETGVDRIGLIDFQDAGLGSTAYDVASLAQDARVDIPADLEIELLNHYMDITQEKDADFDRERFETCYCVLAAQRATKILGIFVRLKERDGKDQYMQHLPRMQDYLKRSLSHPALSDYREWLERCNVINS